MYLYGIIFVDRTFESKLNDLVIWAPKQSSMNPKEALKRLYDMGFGNSKLEKAIGENFSEGEHYTGFENYGNTCYCNSVLQALYYCTPFRDHILESWQKQFRGNAKLSMISLQDRPTTEETESLFSNLCELFSAIDGFKKRVGVIGPRRFVSKLRKENELFSGFMHQDAQEFLNFLLNDTAEYLQKQNKPSDKKNIATFVHNTFEGILTNETKCLTCETVTSRDESFLDLSLDIDQNTSITSCLKKFGATEKFFCDSCSSKQEAQKRIRIKKLPTTLILHLKRFKYIEQLQRHKKLLYRVVFPFELRLPNTTQDAADAERIYDLFAVVVHIGSGPNHGHYVTTIKNNNRWLLFDDDNIELISENDIRQFYGSTNEMLSQQSVRTDCGYLLFYQAREDSKQEN